MKNEMHSRHIAVHCSLGLSGQRYREPQSSLAHGRLNALAQSPEGLSARKLTVAFACSLIPNDPLEESMVRFPQHPVVTASGIYVMHA